MDPARLRLQSLQPTGVRDVAHRRQAVAEADHQYRGWQGETEPGQQSPRQAAALVPDGKARLGTGRTGQKLAESDQLGVLLLVQPAALHHVFLLEVGEMGNGAAEGSATQPQRDEENF